MREEKGWKRQGDTARWGHRIEGMRKKGNAGTNKKLNIPLFSNSQARSQDRS